jgi:hypothetical protein
MRNNRVACEAFGSDRTRTLKIIAQVAWVASLLVLGTLVGVTVG